MRLDEPFPGPLPLFQPRFQRRIHVDEEMFKRLKDAFIEMGNAFGPVQEAMARFAYGLQIVVDRPKVLTKAQRRAKRRRLAAMKREMNRSKHHYRNQPYRNFYDEVDAWQRRT